MSQLKCGSCGKAAGPDLLINEFFKYSRTTRSTCSLLTNMFNVVLLTGALSDCWASGLIVPIYKNKGSKTDPNNYRGISLISCVCKIFTSLL